jgi:hypothetical protein
MNMEEDGLKEDVLQWTYFGGFLIWNLINQTDLQLR